MSAKPWAMLTIVFCTFLTSTAQIFWKVGADQLEFTIPSLLHNYPIFIGIGLYCIGGVLLIVSFRGGDVSTLYPIIATSYIWVSLLSIFFLNEQMNPLKWIGVSTIVTGIVLIGFGSTKKKGVAL